MWEYGSTGEVSAIYSGECDGATEFNHADMTWPSIYFNIGLTFIVNILKCIKHAIKDVCTV